WIFFFFSSRRRHTRWPRDWSSDVCSSDLSRQIADGAARGKIDMGGREYDPQAADPDAAVAAALQAFEDGLYLVVLDEQELKRLRSEERRVGKEGRSRGARNE